MINSKYLQKDQIIILHFIQKHFNYSVEDLDELKNITSQIVNSNK